MEFNQLRKLIVKRLYPNERHFWIGVKMDFTSGTMKHFMERYLKK